MVGFAKIDVPALPDVSSSLPLRIFPSRSARKDGICIAMAIVTETVGQDGADEAVDPVFGRKERRRPHGCKFFIRNAPFHSAIGFFPGLELFGRRQYEPAGISFVIFSKMVEHFFSFSVFGQSRYQLEEGEVSSTLVNNRMQLIYQCRNLIIVGNDRRQDHFVDQRDRVIFTLFFAAA